MSTQDFWKVPNLSLGVDCVSFERIARGSLPCGEVSGEFRDMVMYEGLSQGEEVAT